MTQPPQDPQQPPWPPIPPGGPFGQQPSQPQPGGQQQWPPYQQPWPAQPGPKSSNKGLKWALLALALIAIVAVTVAATVLFTRDDSDGPATAGGNPDGPNGSQDIASANDTGPVGIITEDPTCEAFTPLDARFARQLGDWGQRDSSVPASEWTPQIREMHESAAAVLRSTANQIVPLAKQTPHRVMRELYEQTVAYYRAYADAIPTYTPEDNQLAVTANSTADAAGAICSSIEYLSGPRREALLDPAGPPTTEVTVGDSANPQKFLSEPNPVCGDWLDATDEFRSATDDWTTSVDPNIPVTQWSPQVRERWEAAGSAIASSADQFEQIGRASGNQAMEDFAVLAAQYYRAFAAAIPTYDTADSYLYMVAGRARGAIDAACQATGSRG